MPTPWTFIAFALCALALAAPNAEAQQSATYSMERVSPTSVGGTVTGPTYDSTPLLGQQSPTGAVSFCNIGFTGSLGFWSIRGDLSLPHVLRVDKSAPSAPVIGLRWSGNADLFEVYRAFQRDAVTDAQNLQLITPLCSTSDTEAAASDLIYYIVLPQS